MKSISEESLPDLGLFDADRESIAALEGRVANTPTKVDKVTVIHDGDFTHTQSKLPSDPVFDFGNTDVIEVIEPSNGRVRTIDTIAPGQNPEFVGKKQNLVSSVKEVNGLLVPAVNEEKMMADPNFCESISSGNKEQVTGNQATVSDKRKQTQISKQKTKKVGSIEEAEVTSKDVMILRPILREVHALAHHATLALFDRSAYAYDSQQGDAMIYHSRNILADRFMKSGYEWALWWDDDIVPPIGDEGWSRGSVQSIPATYPGDFLKINPIQRLKSHGVSLVGGLYFGRKAPWTAICHRTTANAKTFINVPRVEKLAVDWVGTGFLLVHRSVFESIQERHPELAPVSGSVNPYESVWNYFQPNHHQAEDVSFCMRAKESGHQPFVDLSVVCFHVGDYAFGPWNQRR